MYDWRLIEKDTLGAVRPSSEPRDRVSFTSDSVVGGFLCSAVAWVTTRTRRPDGFDEVEIHRSMVEKED